MKKQMKNNKKEMNRKAVSGVVTTSLIVLVSIAAIVIIFVIVNSFIRSSNEKATIQISLASTNLEVNPSSVVLSERVHTKGRSISFVVKRTVGDNEIDGVNVILRDAGGKNADYDVPIDNLGVYESKAISLDFSDAELGNIMEISVLPYINRESTNSAISGPVISGDGVQRAYRVNSLSFVRSDAGAAESNIDYAAEPYCLILDAYWNVSRAEEGQTVRLVAEGNVACEGQQVSYQVFGLYQNSSGDWVADSNFVVQTAVFTEGVAKSQWVVVDPLPDSVYRFYFFASLVSDSSIFGRSNDMFLLRAAVAEPDIACIDSDNRSEEDNPFYEEGFVTQLYSECDSVNDIGNKDCDYGVISNDFCKNSNVLVEQTCQNNNIVSQEVNCPRGCGGAVCLPGDWWCDWVDTNRDGSVDDSDVDNLSGNYGRTDCSNTNNWCDGADIDADGSVGDSDVDNISGNYGRTDCSAS